MFTVVYAATAVLMATASLVFRRLLDRWSAATLQLTGAVVAFAAVSTLTAFSVVSFTPLAMVAPTFALTLVGSGLVAPANVVRIQEAGRRSAGTVAALNGTSSYAAGAVMAPLPGLLGPPTVFGVAGLVGLLLAVQLTTLLRDRRLH